jgi:acyl-CoA synthetase (AMP-forming)/AMP-acid ligase II
MLGYLDRAHTREAFDADGWFRSGDLGAVDDDGALTITGRVKDIINRGGEKLSPQEIEMVLVGHPLISAAAVVPAPHPRFGEQPAAFVQAAAGVDPVALVAYLEASGLARQKIPQVWRFVDELPRTPYGKVQKHVLQARITEELASGSPVEAAGDGDSGGQ